MPVLNRFLAAAVFVLTLAAAQASVIVGPCVPIFKGVDHSASQMIADGTNPRNQVVHAVRVDLTDPDVQLIGTPPITNAVNNSRETAGQTTSQFLEASQVQVAINGNFFAPCCGAAPGDPLDVNGLCISQGRMVSVQEDATDAAAFLFTTNKQATFLPTNWPAVSTAGIYTAVCGHYPLAWEGGKTVKARKFSSSGANPSPARGLS